MGWPSKSRESDNVPLNVGQKFTMVLSGYDRYSLPCGWSRPPGIKEGKPIRIRIGKPDLYPERPQRDMEYEAGAQCADAVKVEITGVSERSAFAKVNEIIGCSFERYSDSAGKFHPEYQTDKKGRPRSVELTDHSIIDARNAVSQGGPKEKAGFMGVTTIVRHAKYRSNLYRPECPVWLDKWGRDRNGRYRIDAHPLNAEDKRDVTKEVWIAECSYPTRSLAEDISYGWLYDNLKGFPKNLDNALFFDGPERMLIIYDGGVTDISDRHLQKVVDDFYLGIRPYRFRLVVTTPSSRAQIEEAVGNSGYRLDVQRIPLNFCHSKTL